MIVSAGRSESYPFAKSIGVGVVESSINTTRLILETKAKEILFAGSCGSYGKYNIFESVELEKALNIELSSLQNLSYTPLDFTTDKKYEYVNSSNYITATSQFNDFFLNNNITIENMEFYGVYLACKRLKVPCRGYFVVTNYCSKSAHEEYMKNYKKANEIIIKRFDG
jgi:nucleoside phosphorylase